MTKAKERKQRRIQRSKSRRERRMAKYVAKIQKARQSDNPKELGLSRSRYDAIWPDSNSLTGWSQLCDYQPNGGGSTCQFPCNGDC